MAEERERQLKQIIDEEKLKEPETRKFMENAFRDGEVRTTGTDIEKLMPPVSRFGGKGKAAKKQSVIDKFKSFFERFFGIGDVKFTEEPKEAVIYDMVPAMDKVAETTENIINSL